MPYQLSAAAKQAFLNDIQKPDFVLNGNEYPTLEEVQMIAEQFGLAPGFTVLLEALADGDRALFTEAISSLNVGADTEKLPGRWLVGMWDIVGDLIDDPELYSAAADVIEIHRQLDRGESIEKKAWRQLRRRFSHAGDDLTGAATEVIAAGAWDPGSAEMAIKDSAMALHALSVQQWDSGANWSLETTRQCDEVEEAASAFAREQIGEIPEVSEGAIDLIAVETWVDNFKSSFAAYCKEHCPRVLERNEGRAASWKALQDKARQLLIDECVALA